jgi:hypothetical protein
VAEKPPEENNEFQKLFSDLALKANVYHVDSLQDLFQLPNFDTLTPEEQRELHRKLNDTVPPPHDGSTIKEESKAPESLSQLRLDSGPKAHYIIHHHLLSTTYVLVAHTSSLTNPEGNNRRNAANDDDSALNFGQRYTFNDHTHEHASPEHDTCSSRFIAVAINSGWFQPVDQQNTSSGAAQERMESQVDTDQETSTFGAEYLSSSLQFAQRFVSVASGFVASAVSYHKRKEVTCSLGVSTPNSKLSEMDLLFLYVLCKRLFDGLAPNALSTASSRGMPSSLSNPPSASSGLYYA